MDRIAAVLAGALPHRLQSQVHFAKLAHAQHFDWLQITAMDLPVKELAFDCLTLLRLRCKGILFALLALFQRDAKGYTDSLAELSGTSACPKHLAGAARQARVLNVKA